MILFKEKYWLFSIVLFLLMAGAVFPEGKWESESSIYKRLDVENDIIIRAESHMQKGEYDEACRILAAGPIPVSQKQYAGWLKALALYYMDDYDRALAECLSSIQQDGDNPWLPKIKFLAAEIYLKQKKFEEAEILYSEECRRLLSSERKQDLAGVYMEFAEILSYKPKPEELDMPQPDYNEAYSFYSMILGLEVSERLQEEVHFQLARMREEAKRYSEAVWEYEAYLKMYDPEWRDNVSDESWKNDPDRITGLHLAEARYRLADCLIRNYQYVKAREELEDLLFLLDILERGGGRPMEGDMTTLDKIHHWQRLSLRRIAFTFNFPSPYSDMDLEGGLKAVSGFLEAFPEDSISVYLAWQAVLALRYRGRYDEARQAALDFIEKKGFSILTEESEEEIALRKELGIMQSPLEQFDEYQKKALFFIGQIYFFQKEYTLAIETFNQYKNQFPNGPDWTQAVQGILDSEYMMGVELIRVKDYEGAKEVWTDFLQKYPLDYRSRQILFIFGQMEYEKGKEKRDNGDTAGAEVCFNLAIAEFKKMVSKYPNTEESSLAQFRIGEILENELGDLSGALEAYRQCTWGSYYYAALERINQMVNKKLVVRTERIYRTNEEPLVKIQVRNISKLTLRAYRLDLKEYFLKFQNPALIGEGILDLALIDPDIKWEVEIDGYEDYLPIETYIKIPMEGPGVYAVTVSDEELEATTLVIRSDIDFVVKSSRKECLVFVQNMVANNPVSGADVIITDSSRIIFEGKTNSDGVLLEKLEELKSINDVGVFVSYNNNIATNLMSIYGLSFSMGLSPKGYIYTDRPVYKPGQTVQVRGIIRDVKGGSYIVPEEQVWNFEVSDSGGMNILKENVTLSEFGSFTLSIPLGDKASLGEYSIRLYDEEQKLVFSGRFLVDEFMLEKVKLEVDFDKDVYFRGEEITATFTAMYYYGLPASDKEILYTFPDGRSFRQKTDDEGKLTITFNTSSFSAPLMLVFSGQILDENVSVQAGAFLALTGFQTTVTVNRPVSLAGEPVEITVFSFDPAGRPVSKELKLIVLKKTEVAYDPLFLNVPWLYDLYGYMPAEKTIETFTISTDEKGFTRFTFTPDTGGEYIYRVKGQDRFGNTVVSQTTQVVSGDDDAVKLRMFAERQHFKVGETADIRIYSLLERDSLSLITWEGEEFISYQVEKISAGENPLSFVMAHEHFPNFTMSVAIMQDNRLYSASLPFTVERELIIAIETDKDEYAPGEEAEISIRITDHTGQPVAAEVSLALVNEALFARYKELAVDIVSFFEEGAYRYAEMRLKTSCTFSFSPPTHGVIKEFLEEEERLQKEQYKYEPMEEEEYYFEDLTDLLSIEEKSMDEITEEEGEILKGLTGEVTTEEEPAPSTITDMLEEAREQVEFESIWEILVTTGLDGTGTASFKLPEVIGAYRLTTKACTEETLVGEETDSLTIKKDFFVELKVPAFLQEGDSVRLECQVHNLTDYEGPAELELSLYGSEEEVFTQNITVKQNQVNSINFPSYIVPLCQILNCQVTVKTAGSLEESLKDSILLTVPVRPYGMVFYDSASGTGESSEVVFLSLPENNQYSDLNMTVTVGSSTESQLVKLVLGEATGPVLWEKMVQSYFPAQMPSELLALSELLKYLEGRESAPLIISQIKSRSSAIISSLTALQKSDGSWNFGLDESTIEISCYCFWALTGALEQGLFVDSDVLNRAETYLLSVYNQVDQDDEELKAMILHALSCSGSADFTYINRLYRNRNSLSISAMAYTALCLHSIDRDEMGLELIDILESKVLFDTSPGNYWTGEDNTNWLRSDLETTALVVLALGAINPQSDLVEKGITYLLRSIGPGIFYPEKAKGVVIAALSSYYRGVRALENNYTLKITVNDEEVGEYKVRETLEHTEIQIPLSVIEEGENRVSFQMDGYGQYFYSAVLSGFSTDFEENTSWRDAEIESKDYIHEDLTYKGRSIGTSTMPIRELESGSTARIELDIYDWVDDNYVVLIDYIPSGAVVLKDSLNGNYCYAQVTEDRIIFYLEPGSYIYTLSYEIANFIPGTYRVLPPVIKNLFEPGKMMIGESKKITLLAAGEISSEEYVMNKAELYNLGSAYFEDGYYSEALELLEKLYAWDDEYYTNNVLMMLLWIRSKDEFYNAPKLVEYFEILKEIAPDLYIPFDKIVAVGRAYHDMGEYERAYMVYKATIEASFLKDAPIGGALEQAGEIIGSIDFMTALWQEYPDNPQVRSILYALGQELYNKAPFALDITSRFAMFKEDQVVITKEDLLDRSEMILWFFMSVYPEDVLSDSAAFSMVNLSFDKSAFEKAIEQCQEYIRRFQDSEFYSSFQYMEALGYFSLRQYEEAIESAMVVAESESEDKDFANYILAQIYHVQKKIEQAIEYYSRIEEIYPDARETIEYFNRKSISLDEVTTFKPGEDVEINLDYRNIKTAFFQVYKVDLMKLYLKEKNLSRITEINLSGISPQLEMEVYLGDGKDYLEKEKEIQLNLSEEGAYLVICRGDEIFTSGLVLITPLTIEVQEDEVSGRVRVYVTDTTTGQYANDVHVKVIGSDNTSFVSGETDLRGIFIADDIAGTVTVIARDKEDRYAFFRGESWLQEEYYDKYYYKEPSEKELDYRNNLLERQEKMQELNRMNLDNLYEQEQSGVQIEDAY